MTPLCGIRALELLQRYFEGQMINVLDETNEDPSLPTTPGSLHQTQGDHSSRAETEKSASASQLLAEELRPRSALPPLLVNLADRCASVLTAWLTLKFNIFKFCLHALQSIPFAGEILYIVPHAAVKTCSEGLHARENVVTGVLSCVPLQFRFIRIYFEIGNVDDDLWWLGFWMLPGLRRSFITWGRHLVWHCPCLISGANLGTDPSTSGRHRATWQENTPYLSWKT